MKRSKLNPGPVVCTLALLQTCEGLCVAQEPVSPPPDPPPQEEPLSPTLAMKVRGFSFEGNTAFSDEELAEVVSQYVGRVLTAEQLDEARRALTLHYVAHGYINSGAVLPDQTITDGAVLFRIVEGTLSEIRIRGNKQTKSSYVTERIRRRAGPPLNFNQLKDQLEILRQNPNFDRLNAQLQPGAGPGDSWLDVEIEEDNPFSLTLELSNNRPPSVGAERLYLHLAHTNLTGVSDTLLFDYTILQGGFGDMEFAGDDEYSIAYSRPLTPDDLRVGISYSKTDAPLIEEPFFSLAITSETQRLSLFARQPLYRTPSTELAAIVTGEYERNETFLFGQPFSLSPGAEDGRTSATPLRLGVDFLTRDTKRMIAARSTISFGLPLFGATNHGGDLPDGQFVTWIGQFLYVHRLWETENQLVFRLSSQLASDSLLPLEQFAIGGINTVRGYRENQIVRDNGFVFNVEARIPVIKDPDGTPIVQLVPFLDYGVGWNTEGPRGWQGISSVGIGALVNIERKLDLAFYWGYPFNDLDSTDYDLQDDGISFRVALSLIW